MVDGGIKKVHINEEDLPPISVDSEGYVIRYRVLSEDKNRLSHWSPTFTIKPEYTYTPGNIYFNKAGSIATIVWDAVKILKDSIEIREAQDYDIWTKWDKSDGGDWNYKTRVTGTSISLPIPSTYKIDGVVQMSIPNKLTVEIYLKGIPISRNSSFLLVYQDGPYTV